MEDRPLLGIDIKDMLNQKDVSIIDQSFDTFMTPNFTIQYRVSDQKYRYWPNDHGIIGSAMAKWHDLEGGEHSLENFIDMMARAIDMPERRKQLKTSGLSDIEQGDPTSEYVNQSYIPSFKEFHCIYESETNRLIK